MYVLVTTFENFAFKDRNQCKGPYTVIWHKFEDGEGLGLTQVELDKLIEFCEANKDNFTIIESKDFEEENAPGCGDYDVLPRGSLFPRNVILTKIPDYNPFPGETFECMDIKLTNSSGSYKSYTLDFDIIGKL